ncbi:hypothetical protein ACFC1R_06120 [Kitasatospora sp. NPDC056138]|uniref:hypothetical protein n=1 Tax=Kitasatospora sp. NPDC056138 TaxID=3345724 RepID=UPI0035D60459
MDVQLKSDTGETGYDAGHFYYYAGPVSASSAVTGGLCMVVTYDMQDSAGNAVVRQASGTPCH